jgi:hypothetical protein
VDVGLLRLIADEMVAGRAVPAGLDRGPARGVHRGLRLVGVPGSPGREQAQRPRELAALHGQLIRDAGRALGVGPGHQQPVLFEPLEALGQDVRRDTRKLVEQIVEPLRPGQQGLHDQQCPPVTDLGQCFRER